MKTHVDLENFCLAQKGAVKTFPFGDDTAVIKVMGKMFALYGLQDPKAAAEAPRVNLKADPDWSIILREHYESVIPGYHMNKKHWNTIILDGNVPDDEVREMITHSYNLVVKSLKKADREKLAEGA